MLYGSECWALSKGDVRKIDALDHWCLRRILDIRWYHHVSNWEVRHLTEQPLLTSIMQKRRLMLFEHLIRMDESADARWILTAVPQSGWRRPVGRPHSTLKNDLSLHNLTYEDAIEMARAVAMGGISVYIPPKSVYLKFFYVVVLSPCND